LGSSVTRLKHVWRAGVLALLAVFLVTVIARAVQERPLQTHAAAVDNRPPLEVAAALPVEAAPAVQDRALPPPVTVLAVGDIAACDSTGDEQTATVVASHPGATILTLGDHAYPDGTAAQFATCFDASWGAFRGRIRPVPGNHEYHSANADPYFAYFGASAGPATNSASRGYYSFDVGVWHIVALNSEQDIVPGGAQMTWLRADLAATDRACILAYWHRPFFIASQQYADHPDVKPFWDLLYAAGADIVLNGHDHSYQRYAPMTPDGRPDPGGIRQFVVGTGGRPTYPTEPDARREAAISGPGTFGVLQLTLSETGYTWAFLPVAGQDVRDSGTGSCR
jgi:alkaline phosphatase